MKFRNLLYQSIIEDMVFQINYGTRWRVKHFVSVQNVSLTRFYYVIGPLRICLSTISLLEVAESFYQRKGFSLTNRIINDDYELDSYEKTIIYTVLQKKQITSKNAKHHFHYCTLDQMIKDAVNHHRCVTMDHYHSVTL